MHPRDVALAAPGESPRDPALSQVIAWVPRGVRVLDLGGAIEVGAALAAEKGCHVTRMVVDEAAAGMARGAGMTSVSGSLADPAFRASHGTYDAIVAADFLHTLADPESTLAEMRSFLAPGGSAVLSLSGDASTGDSDPRFPTWESLREAIARAEWKIVDERAYGADLPAERLVQMRWIDQSIRGMRPLSVTRNPVARWLGGVGLVALHEIAGARDVLASTMRRRFPNLYVRRVALLLALP